MSSNSSTSAMGIILYLSLSLFYLSILLEAAYDPVERFSINCGSSGNSSDGDRTWTGDINSNFLSLQDNQTVTAQAHSTSQLPYTTARLSYFEFTYSFPVTVGPKFVRLFFFPEWYPGFDRPNALFTVKFGVYTLLKDFNASLTADANADAMSTIFREYIIHVDDAQRLNLTLTPSTSHPNSYAFVNGIEVVSMPTYLYYTDPSVYYHDIVLVGHPAIPFTIDNNTALETEYRLNVGGGYLPPKQDSGMLRTWEGDDFSTYRFIWNGYSCDP